MASESTSVALSPLEEERFGIRTARVSSVTVESLPSILESCRSQHVKLLIARCRASELDAVQLMEQNGFELMDTLLYYTFDLDKKQIPDDTGSTLIRPKKSGDEEQIKLLAVESFRGYFGHYHADSRLNREACDAAYVSWAVRSCTSPDVADDVLISTSNDIIVGFATMKRHSAHQGEGILFGVDVTAQRQGIYKSLIIHGLRWCANNDCETMVVSTQITNIAVQKVWVRVGFEPTYGVYTLHKWFE